jgi:hypothetical protein
MEKIDLIIDALSVAQNSVWSKLNEQALAAARELKALKPVAWMLPEYGDVLPASQADGTGIYNIPLYTAPPRKEWVGLTDEEIKEVLGLNEASWSLSGVALQQVMDDARALEAKLKEKNT